MFHLSDVFIGEYSVVEFFGANPAIYNARYNIQGYPGIRVSMPSLTPILAGADGFVLEASFEEAGKGKFVTVVHDGFLTTYAHMNDILVQKDEKILGGQLLGHSNQSGLTDIPCLYLGVAPCDNAGNKTEDNGYGGFIDPLGDQVKWDIKNPTEPVTKADVVDKMSLTSKEYSILNAQATNYKVIMAFLKQTTFDDFLKEAGRVPVNLDLTPDDSTGGESVSLYLRGIASEFTDMSSELEKVRSEWHPSDHKGVEVEEVDKAKEEDVPKKPRGFLIKLLHAVKNFIFVA